MLIYNASRVLCFKGGLSGGITCYLAKKVWHNIQDFKLFNNCKNREWFPCLPHDINVAKAVLKACYAGGARLMEFTSRGDFAIETFKELVKYSIAELPGMILGVGSITDAAAASQYMLFGANFVVTPVFRKDNAVCLKNRRKILWTAGCGSLTETLPLHR